MVRDLSAIFARTMRVVVLHSRYGSGAVSGENRVVADEVRLLRDDHHEVELVSPSASEVHGRPASLALRAVWSQESTKHLRSLIRELKPDVIHVHNVFPMLSPAVLRAVDVPVVMTLHNYRLACLPATLLRDGDVCEACVGKTPWRGVVHACYRDSRLASAALFTSITLHRTLGTFDRVALFAAVSDFVRRKHVAAGIDPSKIMVKPNFAWESPIRSGAGEYFLYLGRLSAEKGTDWLLNMWRREFPPLVMAGAGPLNAMVANAAKGNANIRWTGVVSPQEAGRLLQQARAVVVPSILYDAAPRTILEAYAAGVPVIGHDIGGITELVDSGRSGILASRLNATEWVTAVERLTDDSESERMGQEALSTWSRNYSPDVAKLNLQGLYDRAIS